MISNTKSIFKSFSIIQWVYFSANIFSVNESAQSFYLCPTLCDPMRLSLSASSVHGIFLARILEWVTISSSRASSQHREWLLVFYVLALQVDSLLLSHQGSPKQKIKGWKREKTKQKKTFRHHGSCQKSSIILVSSFLHFPTLPSGSFREPWVSPWK